MRNTVASTKWDPSSNKDLKFGEKSDLKIKSFKKILTETFKMKMVSENSWKQLLQNLDKQLLKQSKNLESSNRLSKDVFQKIFHLGKEETDLFLKVKFLTRNKT